MVRLKSGDILEIPLDEQKNKAYIVYIKKSIPFNYNLFGLCAIKPTVEGCDVEKIKSSSFLAKIMIFEDKNWKKIGAMRPNDNFRWPDFYENVLDELDKFRIYHWGEGDKEKVIRIVNGKDNLGSAQPGAVFYPEAALLYFREQLRKAMLYNLEDVPSANLEITCDEKAWSGLYGEVYTYTKRVTKNKKNEIIKRILEVYSDEMIFPDTALQLYMGVLKAEIEENYIEKEVVDKYRLLVMQEKEYLSKEEWLRKQVKLIDEELLKLNLE